MPIDVTGLYDNINALKKQSEQELQQEKQLKGESLYNPKETPFGAYVGGIGGLGNSKFDTEIGIQDLENLDEIRAERQSGLEQLGAGLLKGTGLAATTFATTFTSLPYGILSAIGEGKASNVYDNPISNAFDKFNKSMEEWFPNYYTNEEQNAGAFSPKNWFTMNFLSDKLLKNAGFTVGAIGSGAVVAKGLGALGKIAMAGRYEKELEAVTKLAGEFTGQGMAEEAAFTKALAQVGKGIKFNNGMQQLGGSFIAAGTEASIEALGTKQKTFQDLKLKLDDDYKNGVITSEEYKDKLDKADDAASAAGNVDYLLNLGILTGSNLIQFRKLFGGVRNERKVLADAIKKEGDTFVGDYASRASKITPLYKGMLTEAAEEGSQQFASTGSQDFFSRKYDLNARRDFSDFLGSVEHGLEQTFGTKEGLESMLLGGLTGIISGGATGEIRNEIREINEKDAQVRAAVDELNKYHVRDIYNKNEANIDNAVRASSIQDSMDKALKTGDVYEFLNLKQDLFKSYVLSRVKTGKFDSLMDELDEVGNLPKDEFEKTYGLDPTINDKNASEYTQKLKEEAKKLKDLHENLSLRFSNVSDGVLEQLFDYASNIEHSSKRMDDMYKDFADAPELLTAINNYQQEKTAGNLVLLNAAKKEAQPLFDAKGKNVEEYTSDYLKLLDRRKEMAESFAQASTIQGLETAQARVDKANEIIEKNARQHKARKFVGKGQRVVDKGTDNVVGNIYKVGKEYRLYTEVAENGRPKGEYTVIDPSTEEFLDKYDVHSEDNSMGETRDVNQIVRKLKKITNPDELTDFMNGEVAEKGLNNHPEIRKEAVKQWNSITGENAKVGDSPIFEKKDKVYRNKATGKQVTVTNTPQGTFNVTEKGGKNSVELTKEQLDVEYDYMSTKQQKWSALKPVYVETLERMITAKEAILQALKDKISDTKVLDTLKQQLKDLEELLVKKDGRTTTNGKKETLKRIQELQVVIAVKEEDLEKLIDEQEKLKRNLNYLYERLEQESEDFKVTELDEVVKNVEDSIKDNEYFIKGYKDYIKSLKDLINRILDIFKVERLYTDRYNSSKLHGKERGILETKFKKAVEDAITANEEFEPTLAKLRPAQIQFERFEKIEAELYEKLDFIEEERGELTNKATQLREEEKKAKITVKEYPRKDTTAASSKKKATENDYKGDGIDTSTEAETSNKEVKSIFTSAKRTLSNLYNGLAGRHRKNDANDTITDDTNARRYYRFTGRHKLVDGKFYVRLSKGERFEQYDNEADKTAIVATVVNDKGEYVDEFGKVTTNPAEYVFTNLAVSDTTIEAYQPEGVDTMEFLAQQEVLKKEHLQRRAEILAKLDKDEPVTYQIIGKGIGVPRYNKDEYTDKDKISLKDAGISLESLNIKVATSPTTKFENGEAIHTKEGFTYAEDTTTKNIIPLQPRKLSTDEVELVVKLFKYFIKNHKIVNGLPNSTNAGVLQIVNKKGEVTTLDYSVFDVLQQLSFWTGNNLRTAAAEKVKDKKNPLNLTEALKDKKNLININLDTAFHFIPSNVPGGEIAIGKNSIPLFTRSKGQFVENPGLEEALRTFLGGKYVQIESSLLTNKSGVIEVTEVNLEGAVPSVTVNDKYDKPDGYKEYLLDKDMLTTTIIAKGTEVNGEEIPQFSSQYAIVNFNDEKKIINKPIEAKTLTLEDVMGVTDDISDSIFDTDKVIPDVDGDGFPLFREAKEEPSKKIDIDEARSWVEKTFGNKVSFDTVARLIRSKYWGQYKNALITIYEGAEVGTEYHEAFHAVRDMFLSDREAKALFNEWRKANDSTLSDREVEEILAEDFRDYMMGKEIKYFAPKQRTFFQKVLDFIKGVLFNQDSSIQVVFDRIRDGYYVDKEFTNSDYISKYSSSVKGLNVKQTKDVLDGVNAFFFKEIFSNPDHVATLFNKEDNASLVSETYKIALENIKAIGKNLLAKQAVAKTDLERQELQDKINALKIAIVNWNEVRQIHRDYLNRYNLEISESEDWVDNLDETERLKSAGAVIPTESLKFSSKINSSRNIKLLIGALPVVKISKEGNKQGVLNDLGLPFNVDFGKVFNALSNNLSNLTSWEDMIKVLDRMSSDIPSLQVLKTRLGGDKQWEGLESSEIQLRLQFIQTFAKSSNTFTMDIVGKKGTAEFINANVNSFERKRLTQWESNARKYAGNNHYKMDGNKQLYNVEVFKKAKDVTTVEDAKRMLKLLGIDFSNPEKITDYELVNRTNAILNVIRKGTGESIYAKTGDVKGNLKYFLNLEAATTVNNVENSLYNLNGDLVYGETLNSYISLILNQINNENIVTKEDLFKALPHLRYVENSLVLNKMFEGNKKKGKIEASIHMGSKEEDSGNTREFKDMTTPDTFRVRFNQGINGIYNLLRPADNGIERFINFGVFFNRVNIGQDKHLDAFVDYLKSEIKFGRISKTSNWNNLRKNSTKGILLDIIKKADPSLYNEEILPLITDKKDSVEVFFSELHNIDLVKNAIEKYIDLEIAKNKQLLIENKIVSEASSDGNHVNNAIAFDKPTPLLNKEGLNSVVKLYTINSLIANIEQVKLFLNSPQYFKSVEVQFKRHSGYVGTKKISITDEFLNNWIDSYLDKTSKVKQAYDGKEPIIRTAIINDVKGISKYFDAYKQLLGEDANPYNGYKEPDGQGYIHFDEYRRMLVRSGDWTFGKGSLEEAYQYENGNKDYVDPKTGETWKINVSDAEKIVFNPLKPQHFGPLAEEGFIPGLYKLSLVPLIPSLVRQNNLSKLNTQMELQQSGIVVFASANTVGTKLNDNGTMQEMYKNGEFAFNNENRMLTQNTYYKYWGIQVDMGNKSKNKVVTGTQMMKHIFNGLFSGGVPQIMRFVDYKGNLTTKNTQEVFDTYLKLNEERLKLGLQELIESLGLTKVGENYAVKDAKVFIEKVRSEAISRQMPDNIVEGIEYIKDNGIDALPNREKIENILFSLADSTSVSMKRFGKASVQVASTLVEKGVRTAVTKGGKTVYVSNDLNFYGVTFEKDGKTPKRVTSMEVYLPEIYRGLVDIDAINANDPRLLKLLGFRIPTQGLNSIESIVVKGFLPKSAGDMIVVPAELVAKAGSDFDIDKLNLYIPNFYRGKKGQPIYITNSRTAWERYQLDNVLEGEEDKLLTWEQWSRKGIENELTELMHEIVTSPDNAVQLLTPNSAAGLKDEADYILWLKSGKKGTFDAFKAARRVEEENTPYNKMIETSYLIDAANKFLGANTSVGITALYSAFNVICQTNNIYINSTPGTKLNLPHRETAAKDIALGELYSVGNAENIPQSLSEWINAAVDATKDPFMFDMNANTQTLNVILYLTKAGVPRRTINLFMNQPIILDYVSNQNKYESIIAEENKFKMFPNQLREFTAKKYGTFSGFINSGTELDNETLEKEITGKPNNTTQLQALDDFLRYQEVSKYLGDAIKGAGFDTKAGGKNTSEMYYNLMVSENVLFNEVVGNYDKLLDEGFITPYYKNVQQFEKLFTPYILHLKYPEVRRLFRKLLLQYTDEKVKIPKDRVVKVIDKFKQDFITYLLMTSPREKGLTLGKDINRLFKDKDNMAVRTSEMKDKYPNNLLLESLFPIHAKETNGVSNIKMYSTKIDTLESNRLTEDWEQLFNGGPEEVKYANDLMDFIIIQSGLQNSPMNFISLVPMSQYNTLITKAISRLERGNDSFEDFYEQFFFMNYENNDIMPKRKTEGFDYYKNSTFTINPDSSRTYGTPDFFSSDGTPIRVINPAIKDYGKNSTLQTYGAMIIERVKGNKEKVTKSLEISENDIIFATPEEIDGLPECI
jgi:Fe-S cluster biosynthesis and repair protein YggX